MNARHLIDGARIIIAGAAAWISAKLGALGPLLAVLIILMLVDYVTGMWASKIEAVDHPDDPAYGWSSAKGAKGIAKKVGYICVITVALALDYLIVTMGAEMGFSISMHGALGMLVCAWYILNELLSVAENAGRMGAPVPEWLTKYIAAIKSKVDAQGGSEAGHDGR